MDDDIRLDADSLGDRKGMRISVARGEGHEFPQEDLALIREIEERAKTVVLHQDEPLVRALRFSGSDDNVPPAWVYGEVGEEITSALPDSWTLDKHWAAWVQEQSEVRDVSRFVDDGADVTLTIRGGSRVKVVPIQMIKSHEAEMITPAGARFRVVNRRETTRQVRVRERLESGDLAGHTRDVRHIEIEVEMIPDAGDLALASRLEPAAEWARKRIRSRVEGLLQRIEDPTDTHTGAMLFRLAGTVGDMSAELRDLVRRRLDALNTSDWRRSGVVEVESLRRRLDDDPLPAPRSWHPRARPGETTVLPLDRRHWQQFKELTDSDNSYAVWEWEEWGDELRDAVAEVVAARAEGRTPPDRCRRPADPRSDDAGVGAVHAETPPRPASRPGPGEQP